MSDVAPRAGAELPEDPAVDAVVDAGRLDTALSVVGALVDECRVEFAAEGLRVRAVDPASVAAVSLDLRAATFERYDAAGATVGVDVTRFAEGVGLADTGSTVRLVLETERRQLHLLVGELSYTLGLIDPDAIREPLDPAEMAYNCPAGVTVTGRDVARIADAADMVADHLTLGVDAAAGAFYAEAAGDTDDVSISFPGESLQAFSPADAESLFSLDYLQELSRPIPADAAVLFSHDYLQAMARPIPSDSEVALELGTEQPVTLSFDVGEDGDATFLLSPRLSTT
jgi:proliferating cell nuclear antigen